MEDAFRLARDQATFGRAFVFPPYVGTLFESVRGLTRAGFQHTSREEKQGWGKALGARIVAPTGEVLDLGDVLVDGETGNISVFRPLRDIQTLVRFIDRATIAP